MSATYLRDPLIVFASAVLLSACAGTPIPTLIADNGHAHPQTSAHKHRFIYTGKETKFVVPSGVTALTIVADGAQGGGDTKGHYSEPPGLGGEMSAVVPVRPGEKLYVFVGGEGAYQRRRGYNGGGDGGSGEYGDGYYGGGASDVREGGDALHDRILVAGGGGGAGGGFYLSGDGGAGGGVTGGRGCCRNTSSDDGIGGSGGTQVGSPGTELEFAL